MRDIIENEFSEILNKEIVRELLIEKGPNLSDFHQISLVTMSE